MLNMFSKVKQLVNKVTRIQTWSWFIIQKYFLIFLRYFRHTSSHGEYSNEQDRIPAVWNLQYIRKVECL